MVDEILKFTKITFLIHLIIGLIFSIMYWIPEITIPLFGWSYTAMIGALSQVIGAAGAGLTISSLFGYLAKEWKEVKIVVILEIVWLGAALVAVFLNILALGIAVVLNIILFAILFILFLLSYLQQEEIIGELFQGK